MNARILGLVGVMAAVMVGCKDDPTNTLVGTPARVGFEFATVRLTVADSLATFAVVRDQGSTPLVIPVTVTACDPTTVSVVHVAPGTPEVQTNFFIKGIKFGTACVIATASGLTDTMQVATVPDHIAINSGPDSIVSGDSGTYTFQYHDKNGAVMTGPAAPTWKAATKDLGLFNSSAVPVYAVFTPGANTLTATFTLSALGGTVTQTITNTKIVNTVPIVAGTPTTHSVVPGGTILLQDPLLAGFKYDTSSSVLDSTSGVSVGGIPTYVTNHANDSIRVVIPPFGNTKNQRMVVIHLGAKRLSIGTGPADSVSNSSAVLTSPYFPGDTAPTTTTTFPAPQTAADTTVIVGINSGTCTGGLKSAPADHCDSFFKVTNGGASPVTVNIQTDWYIGAFATVQDMFVCEDATCTGTIQTDGATSTATTPSNPEQEPGVTIPAGATYTVWVNNAISSGAKTVLFRVLITH